MVLDRGRRCCSIVVCITGLILLFPNFDQVRAVMILANITHAIAALLVVRCRWATCT